MEKRRFNRRLAICVPRHASSPVTPEEVGFVADAPHGQGVERRCVVRWPNGRRSTEKVSDLEIVERVDDSRDYFSKLTFPTPSDYHGRRK